MTDRHSGEEETRPISNVVLMLGAVPNTEWLHGAVELNPKGFIRSGTASEDAPEAGGTGRAPAILETSRPGIFAVGDVRAGIGQSASRRRWARGRSSCRPCTRH